MWRRLRLKKNCEARHREDLEEAMNESLYKEQKSQQEQLALWKDRPRQVKEEMPDKVFQELQKQHSLQEDDS
jgi:hypothetical protein